MTLETIFDIAVSNWPMFLRGALSTLEISIISTILGTVLGLVIGIIRTIPQPERGPKKIFLKIVNGLMSVYIEVFRGTPMIVQAMIIYYGVANTYGIDMDRTFAAILIVTINTGAYMSEIVRGGILSIDKGQYEAAQSVGMTHFQTMMNVVLPQVIRNIMPATGNEFVINIKDTSVLNVISVTELFFATKSVAGVNYMYMETFIVAALIYLVMTFSVTRILRFIERKMDGPENYNLTGNQMQVLKPEDMAHKSETRGN
ncbi:amino acid ABC transporter permease [Proteiniclasticum sp. SCR006]|uniref:Amino acid ABC transporter permease n=1 Tax=Proteiniclasticum aestuarii TaxID=2817862 RepID=A0A939KLT0_9CLOT|nr:amino acid ABC transporter permease [Proteiniclasticum aestuarii]MBO1265995.1 amino acid ABC transporter permease [Proteiniclasticum aestuarii]